jgi:hypothetical protein
MNFLNGNLFSTCPYNKSILHISDIDGQKRVFPKRETPPSIHQSEIIKERKLKLVLCEIAWGVE